MAVPSTFSAEQISQFLSYIDLPPSLQTYRYSVNPTTDLDFLTQLHVHTISAIPYENLWLHYNPTHTNTINPQTTFTNIVTNARGRGGYCFQVSIFFNHILRGLGFPAYLTPVRIRLRRNGVPYGDYGGWRHLVNIVTLSNSHKFSLDIGFGGDGPTAPIRLIHNHTQTNLGAQEVRLTRDWIPAQLSRTEETKLWVYQYRNAAAGVWNSFYAFGEAEAMEGDFEHLNWYTASHPQSFQTFRCLVVKFLRRWKSGVEGEGEEQEVYGKRMLVNGVVKENLGGRTKVVEDCKTEEERVRALEKWFGIKLTEGERRAVSGWGTELKGDGSEGVEARQRDGHAEVWELKRGEEYSYTWKDPKSS